MKYQVGDELYLRIGEDFEGPVRVTHVGSKFNVLSDDLYYIQELGSGETCAVEGAWLSPLTSVGALKAGSPR